jgi:Transposase zinc-binding domain
MVCGPKEAGGVYHPRQPQPSSLYQLVERFYPEFERVYSERYQERYGFWRPIIARAVEKFLKCGDLKEGFARVRCSKCRHELFVAFSCRGRCFCRSVGLPGRSDPAPAFALLSYSAAGIPELGEHLIRYYGWYSNKKRGQRAQAQPPTPEGSAAPPTTIESSVKKQIPISNSRALLIAAAPLWDLIDHDGISTPFQRFPFSPVRFGLRIPHC